MIIVLYFGSCLILLTFITDLFFYHIEYYQCPSKIYFRLCYVVNLFHRFCHLYIHELLNFIAKLNQITHCIEITYQVSFFKAVIVIIEETILRLYMKKNHDTLSVITFFFPLYIFIQPVVAVCTSHGLFLNSDFDSYYVYITDRIMLKFFLP